MTATTQITHRLEDVKFRLWLAGLATLQFCLVFLNTFTNGFLIFLPFSSIAIVIVFVAIFCKWKKGIYAFILASFVLFVLALVSFCTIVFRDTKTLHWNVHRLIIYMVQIVCNGTCIVYGILALLPQKAAASQGEESKGFLSKETTDKWVRGT